MGTTSVSNPGKSYFVYGARVKGCMCEMQRNHGKLTDSKHSNRAVKPAVIFDNSK